MLQHNIFGNRKKCFWQKYFINKIFGWTGKVTWLNFTWNDLFFLLSKTFEWKFPIEPIIKIFTGACDSEYGSPQILKLIEER